VLFCADTEAVRTKITVQSVRKGVLLGKEGYSGIEKWGRCGLLFEWVWKVLVRKCEV